ncbi:MAG TPA: M15 family metallopeptidase [Nocardioidaceae bacterium]|nr:M15 family metallopeptidase [Nocardioidaceae bacterium]
MNRQPIIAAALLLALVLAGPVGAATAEDEAPGTTEPSATDTGTPAPTTPTNSTPTPAANRPPSAADDTARATAGRPVTIDVLANDADDGLGRPDGTPAGLEVVGVDGGGDRVTFTSQTLVFEPAREESGEVTLRYLVSDGELESTGTVTVTVTAAPVAAAPLATTATTTAVRRTVTLYLAAKPVALRHYRIHGRVSPQTPGPVRVRIQQRLRNGDWKRFARVTVNQRGRYSARFTPRLLEKYTFRAVADWPDRHHKRSGEITRQVYARADVRVSGPLRRRHVRYSWRSGCPVPPRDLRRIDINRFDFSHRVRRGSLIVRADEVTDVVKVLRRAFYDRFPIRMMRPTDTFYRHGRRTPQQSDIAAMRAGNTSAFNCRPVTGNPYRISQHSYGNAIDINTIRNPYVTGSRVYPSWARRYLDRSRYRKGMIMPRGVIATRMRRQGWLWGARWSHPDYQHFSSNGG